MNRARLSWGKRVAFALSVFAAVGPAPVAAQESTGRIVGRVLNSQTGEPLVNAQVALSDMTRVTLSNLDGRFVLRDVAEGIHSVMVRSIGYVEKTVTEVMVAAGRTEVLNISVSIQAVEIEGITVSAAAEMGSTVSLLMGRKTAAITQDAIGADQIARSPDGDAGSALKRVPGLTVVDGKYAYVRGLGDRYSQTTLNGAPLASPVPDKKAIPLNVIPASLIESIITLKSFSPDQPGDYAGGLVALTTKKFPNEEFFDISFSGGVSSTASFREGLTYAGGSYDFLGFDDGSRDLPSSVPQDRTVRFGNFTRQELQTVGLGFGGDWGPTLSNLPANSGFGVTYGNSFDIGKRRLGLLAAVTQSSAYERKSDVIERVFAASGASDPEVDYTGEITTRNVSLGGLLNVAFELANTHQIKFEGVYNRLTEDLSRVLQGFNLDSNTNQRNTRIQYTAQELLNAQLSGAHLFDGLGDLAVDWRVAYTRAKRLEPNTREVLYREFDGAFLYDDFVQSGSVFHQNMVDSGYNGAIDLTVPFLFNRRQGKFKLGGAGTTKDRNTITRRFRFRPVPGGEIDQEIRTRDPNDLFTAETINPSGFEIQEATFRTDNYSGGEDVYAAYGMVDLELVDNFRLVAGARWESSRQVVTTHDFEDLGLVPIEGANLDVDDLLPSLNLTFSLNDEMNLRAGFSKTLARPQLRELAPFSFADYAGGYLVIGNPLLEQTSIQNLDVRWEWFYSPRALIAVSGFYKKFTDPIEVLVLPSTELIRSWVNVGNATNFGAEFEVRSSLGPLSESLSDFSINANVTVVQSDVSQGSTARIFIPGQGRVDLAVVERTRPLQGQSPYVLNTGLTYAPLRGATTASVLFNRFGRRIDSVGRQATPDIFEEARSQLDLTIKQRVWSGVSVKFSASRLVGNIVEFKQGGELLRQWDAGRRFSLSFNWEG